jgi:hypothetical protein
MNLHPPRLSDDPERLQLLTMSHCVLAITTRCQQRCLYCFEGKHQRRDMPLAEVRRHLERASQRMPGVVFMGAESSLHPDFVGIIAYANALGLRVMVSSNLLKFADADYLRRCVDAGLSCFEFSFPYPDADAFSTITRTPPRNFERLLLAMENVGRICADRNARSDQKHYHAINANLVVSSANVASLRRVVGHISKHLSPSVSQVTFRRLMRVRMNGTDAPAALVPDGEAARHGIRELLDGWIYARTFALIRGFPLCIVPGHEHLHADLLYHCRQSRIVQNLGMLPRFTPMCRYSLPRDENTPAACRSCSLSALCRAITHGTMARFSPGLAPAPSRRDPLDVLRNIGINDEESRTFMKRIDTPIRRKGRKTARAAAHPAPLPARDPAGDFSSSSARQALPAIAALVRAALRRYRGSARPVRLDHMRMERTTEGENTLDIRIRSDGAAIYLCLAGSRPDRRWFAKTRRLSICYATTPFARGPKLDHLVQFILRAFDRVRPAILSENAANAPARDAGFRGTHTM